MNALLTDTFVIIIVIILGMVAIILCDDWVIKHGVHDQFYIHQNQFNAYTKHGGQLCTSSARSSLRMCIMQCQTIK